MRNKMKLMAGVLSVTLAGGPLLPPAALTAWRQTPMWQAIMSM